MKILGLIAALFHDVMEWFCCQFIQADAASQCGLIQTLSRGRKLMSQEPEILFKSETVLVWLMTLAANEIGQRHYHSNLFETIICTEGKMTLCAGEREPVELSPRQQASVPSPQPHHVQNLSPGVARYILVQASGAYDFLLVT